MSEKERASFLKINFKKAIETQYGKLIKGYIKREELIEQLKNLEGKYVNFILGFSENNEKHYMKIDTWKPEKKDGNITNAAEIDVEEIPF